MDVTVKAGDLVRELDILEKASSRKPTIPIYACGLLETSNGTLQMAACDGTVSMRTACVAEIKEEGKTTVPVARLRDIAKTMGLEAQLRLTATDTKAIVEGADFKATLQTLPVADFPQLPTMGDKPAMLSVGLLSSLIPRVRIAVTVQEDTRYAITGALFDLDGKHIRMASTDTHRIAIVDHALKSEKTTAIVPKRSLDILSSLIDGMPAEEVVLFAKSDHVFFATGVRTFSSQLLEGTFPNYQRLVPEPTKHPLRFDSDVFKLALKRAALLGGPRGSVTLDWSKNKLRVQATSAEIGEADQVITVEYDGEPVSVMARAVNLVDFIDAAKSEMVEMHYNGKLLLLRAPVDGLLYDYVVMPLAA